MKIKSERGQIALVGLLALAIIVAMLMFGMAANSRGMQAGANTIANSITNGNQVTDTYVMWKGMQVLYPNKHALKQHPGDAEQTVDCYNRNGALYVLSNDMNDFYLLCKENRKLRMIILKRRAGSSIFDFVNAYTKGNGEENYVLNYLRQAWGAKSTSMPSDAVIVIDGVVP